MDYEKDFFGRPKKRERCACMSWTTANGEIRPLMVKAKDNNGEVQTLQNIEVLSSKKKMVMHQVAVWTFVCRTVLYETSKIFILTVCSIDGIWEISWV